MKVFIFILTLAVFLQSSFVPINLVLILLIARSLARPEKENLYAAFLIGIILSLLQAQNLGFWALAFLLIVKLVSLNKKLPFSRSLLVVFSFGVIALSLGSLMQSFYFKQSFDLIKLIWEVIFFMPSYFVVLFWEDRFVAKPEGRLKLRS